MSLAEQLRQEGRSEGRSEGLIEGEQRGEQRGELKNKLETAKEMLIAGSNLAVRVTKLPLKEIKQLQKEIDAPIQT